jgi:ribosome-associated protein
MMSPEDKAVADVPISRTRKKKEDHARQKLGERLVGLSEEQLERLDLPNELREAVSLARKTTQHGARHRQVKYVGALLRQVDTAPIEKTLDDIARGDYEKAYAFKKIESWRDQLREENPAVVEEILLACPLAQRQQLTQLARNAKKEFEGKKGVKASRALFRYLKEVSEN